MFHEKLKRVQCKVLMEKFWASHRELKTEENLVVIKYQGCFYQVDPFRLLGLVTLRVKGPEKLRL